ncbi:MAG: GWxTD domain-containing protein [Chitinivibrionia bacterium]|nr:GWxTD domain-containing protein [Chitinivibrionia bacterium]
MNTLSSNATNDPSAPVRSRSARDPGRRLSAPAFARRAVLGAALAAALLPAFPFPAGAREGALDAEAASKLSPSMRQEIAGLQYLLNKYQIRQFLSLASDSLRSDWLRMFWKSQDPTPSTAANEKRMEHSVRTRLARQYFAKDAWPGWDKRGEVFIRYGPPDFREKVWGEITNRRMFPPGEIWFYKLMNMLVSFQNFGLKGEYIYSLDPLGADQNLSPDMVEFLLYDTEHSLSSHIPQDLLELYDRDLVPGDERIDRAPQLPENIDAIMNPDQQNFEVSTASEVFQRDKMHEAANNFETALKETPVNYPFNFTAIPLPFFFDIDQFKAGNGLNRIEIHVEIPAGTENARGATAFETVAVVWDAEYHEIARSERTLSFEPAPGEQKKTHLLPAQHVFTMERGYYRASISARERGTERATDYRTAVSVEDLYGSLAVSGILFAQRITEARTPTAFTRGPLEIIPHPIHAYRKSFAIPVYFEIYNLRLNDRGSSSYAVEYKIVPHSAQKKHFWDQFENTVPAVSSRFVGSGRAADELQRISLKTDNLSKGSYDLLITVEDENARAVAFRKASFSIVE